MSIISENFGMYVHCMGFGICEFAFVRCSQIVSNTEYECVWVCEWLCHRFECYTQFGKVHFDGLLMLISCSIFVFTEHTFFFMVRPVSNWSSLLHHLRRHFNHDAYTLSFERAKALPSSTPVNLGWSTFLAAQVHGQCSQSEWSEWKLLLYAFAAIEVCYHSEVLL